MNKQVRRRFLQKLAAKTEKTEKVKGKHNSKTLAKILEKLKKQYSGHSSALKDAQSQVDKLKTIIEEHSEGEALTRAEMKKVHSILTNLDFSGADEVIIGNDEDDVSYVRDGKRYTYKTDTNELCKYEKKVKKEEETDDVNDLSEGIDVNLG
jgi:seryl-tRNA synthetase